MSGELLVGARDETLNLSTIFGSILDVALGKVEMQEGVRAGQEYRGHW